MFCTEKSAEISKPCKHDARPNIFSCLIFSEFFEKRLRTDLSDLCWAVKRDKTLSFCFASFFFHQIIARKEIRWRCFPVSALSSDSVIFGNWIIDSMFSAATQKNTLWPFWSKKQLISTKFRTYSLHNWLDFFSLHISWST